MHMYLYLRLSHADRLAPFLPRRWGISSSLIHVVLPHPRGATSYLLRSHAQALPPLPFSRCICCTSSYLMHMCMSHLVPAAVPYTCANTSFLPRCDVIVLPSCRCATWYHPTNASTYSCYLHTRSYPLLSRGHYTCRERCRCRDSWEAGGPIPPMGTDVDTCHSGRSRRHRPQQASIGRR